MNKQKCLRPIITIEEKIERLKEQNFFHNVLYEAYTKRSLKWMDNLFNLLNTYPEKRNEQFIIQEFKKHDIIVHFKDDNRSSVLNAYYEHKNGFGDGDLTLILSTNCLQDFIKESSTILLKLEIKNCIIHEDTHFQQDQYSFNEWKNHYVDIESEDLENKSNDNYCNQVEEIDAYARETAFCLIEIGRSKNEVQNLLKTTEGIKELIKDLSTFNQAGPLVRYINGKIIYPRSWHRFLREMLKYLEENGSNPNSSKISDEYSIKD